MPPERGDASKEILSGDRGQGAEVLKGPLIGAAIAAVAIVLAIFLFVPSLLPTGLLGQDRDGLSSHRPENLSPAAGGTVFGPNITLEWTGDADADSYSILITVPGSSIAAINLTATTNSYDLDGVLSSGEYLWKVQAVEDGAYGPFSDATLFTIRTSLDAPSLQSPADGSMHMNSVPTLRWSEVDDALGYRVQIASDAAFGSVMVDVRVDATMYIPTFALGDEAVYSWRVAAYHGEAWSSWSSVRQFSHDYFLAAPMPVSPASGSAVSGDQVNLTWSAVDGADSYQVQVSAAADFSALIVNNEVADEWCPIPAELDDGATYHWRVQAVNEVTVSSWSAAYHFTVAQDALPFSYTWTYNGQQFTLSGSVPGSDYYYLSGLARNYDYVSYVMNDDPTVSYVATELKSMAEGAGYGGELAQFILTFVQNVNYTEDMATTGQVEYPRYPAETLVDGGGDCEDKSALYASLMQCPVINVDAVMVMYTSTTGGSGHMAVAIEGSFSGTYYAYGGKNYFFCETTGVGWRVGEFPEDLESYTAEVRPC